MHFHNVKWILAFLTVIFVPMKLLMVCLGNICRSPLAEGILRHKAQEQGLNWTIDSAGTNSYHIGQPPHRLSQKVAQCNGLDISNQVARRFRPEDLERYDIIYAMAADVIEEMKEIAGTSWDPSKVVLFMNELYAGEDRDVPDPWYGEEDGYHHVYQLLDKTSDAILKKYSTING